MIDEKKIEEEVDKRYWDYYDPDEFMQREAFTDGIEWAQKEFAKSLWHKAEEKPKNNTYLIELRNPLNIMTDKYGFKAVHCVNNEDWAKHIKVHHVIRWMYIDGYGVFIEE